VHAQLPACLPPEGFSWVGDAGACGVLHWQVGLQATECCCCSSHLLIGVGYLDLGWLCMSICSVLGCV
jgi:hypothetical protein